MREITTPVGLTDADGRLNRDAVGFARSPLIDAAGLTALAKGRNKRWEHWTLVTPRFTLTLNIADLDYAGTAELWLLDRETGKERHRRAVLPFGRGVAVAASGAAARSGQLMIGTEEGRIVALAPGIELDLLVAPAGEVLAVTVPWSATRFHTTVKDVGRRITGRLRLDAAEHPLAGWGVLDRGRGRWPYRSRWRWGAGFDPDRDVGLQLGGGWTDGTGSRENALFAGGRVHVLDEDLRWSGGPDGWHVEGERIDARLAPEHRHRARVPLGLVATSSTLDLGRWSGWVVDDAGERVELDGMQGWVEDVRNRW